MRVRPTLLSLLLLGLCLLALAPASAGAATSHSLTGTSAPLRHYGEQLSIPAGEGSNTPTLVPDSEKPPAGRHLSADQAIEIAERLPKMKHLRHEYPGAYPGAYLDGPGRWQVSFFSRAKEQIGQVIIDDATGKVLEQWTGFQVAWTMARGYSGAFGRHADALYVWLPLCLLFLLPFFDWRRPFSLIHLDLLVLLSFSISLAFFNHGHIFASVPLVYPPLLYLLTRMLLIARPRLRAARAGPPAPAGAAGDSAPGDGQRAVDGDREPAVDGDGERSFDDSGPAGIDGSGQPAVEGEEPAPGGGEQRAFKGAGQSAPLRLFVPVSWLVVGIVFLLAFRIGLNVIDSNVIDVGYAGVIGAQRITAGERLYGSFPSDNEHGDTYGPFNYEAYVPFEQVLGWSGQWDDLPAAHGAAIAFDVLVVALLFLLGRRVRGPDLGIVLAYAWLAFPFTLFTLNSNSNDALVALLILAALLATRRNAVRGALTALAGLTKFAPLALAPLLGTEGMRGPDGRIAWRRGAALASFLAAFVVAGLLAFVPALLHDSLHTFYERTIVYQVDRGAPFSVWGLYGGLSWLQDIVVGGAILLALALALLPRRADLVGLAAACAAVLIAVQLGLEYWFYLYIVWFLPLVLLALFARSERSAAGRGMRIWSIESARNGAVERISTPISQGSSSEVWNRTGMRVSRDSIT
jgi:hypothetical protein